MPRSQAPLWRQRKEPILDHLVKASIEQAGGTFDPVSGHYAKLVYRGIEDRERAAEIERALRRSAYYMHKHGIADVSAATRIVRDGETWAVEFHAVNKMHARAYVLKKYGPDRTKWPYSPRRGDSNYG